MRSFPVSVRSVLIPLLILVLCLSGCLAENKPADDPRIRETNTTSASDLSESSLTPGFSQAGSPALTSELLIQENIGQKYALVGVLTEAKRANSGSILLTIQTNEFDCQVYIRSGLAIDPYFLCIGESYQVVGILDEYKGTFEIIPESPEDILHDGQYDFEEVTVVSVIDGDTIKIEFPDGTVEKLRVIGVDAPETKKQGQAGEYFADEATQFAKDLLLDNTVYLERDNSDTDKYGRLLRYVWLEIPGEINEAAVSELNLSALLLHDGYAEDIRVGDDNKYAELFSDIDQAAEEAGLGMWAEN